MNACVSKCIIFLWSLQLKVQGLCGNFNFNTKDDFGIEESAISFGNSWAEGNCADVPNNNVKLKPCEIYQQKKKYADTMCSKLEQAPFTDCHGYVDPKPFVENCIQDVCGCRGTECHCSVMAAYAKQCSMQGVAINWRVKGTCRKCHTKFYQNVFLSSVQKPAH